jgi:hypothetical protein
MHINPACLLAAGANRQARCGCTDAWLDAIDAGWVVSIAIKRSFSEVVLLATARRGRRGWLAGAGHCQRSKLRQAKKRLTPVGSFLHSCSQDQLVQLRQPQPVNPTLMVDLDFTHVPEQVLAPDPRDRRWGRRRCPRRRTGGSICSLPGRSCHD